MRISIFHNIMWSKYKGGVFSALHRQTAGTDIEVTFTQIATTDSGRVALGDVDMTYHQYPHELIFSGSYSEQSLLKRVVALVPRVWRAKADLVILPGYERFEYWAMLLTCIVRRVPRAVFCDSTVFDQKQTLFKSLAKRFFFSRCDGFFGYGTRSREYLTGLGVPSERIFFRCQAAALSPGYTEEMALAVRIDRAPAAGSPPRFLYVGRLSREKGLDVLVRAMSQVVRAQPQAQLRLAGAGPLQQILREQADAAGLASNIHFAGSMDVQQLASEYAAATALVLPSTSEPWGLVVNEALSHGCPVVVSYVCGCVPEMVIEGQTGYVFEVNSVDELTRCLLTAHVTFANSQETARVCIAHMRRFTPDRAAQQITEGCRAIVAGHTPQELTTA